MAASSRLDKVGTNKRTSLKTMSYSFGELIKFTLDEHVEEIFLGIGGVVLLTIRRGWWLSHLLVRHF